MKLWILGKRGILSSAMQRKCKEKGIDFVATSRKEVDLHQEEAIQAQFETLSFTHVINCAAYTAVDRAEEEEEKAHALNARAIEILAKHANAYRKKLIHFSTDYVFDGKEKGYGEDSETAPLSIYGKSKEAGEKLLKKYHPEACLIRTSWLFGKEGNHFVKTMVRLMQEKEMIGVVSDQWGRPTYADDLAEAALTLLDASGTYHFANAGETTWHGFAEAIKKSLEKNNVPLKCQQVNPISTEDFGVIAKRPASSILKTENFSPPHWEEGLEEVIRHALKTK
ncbi:MAG: dTDP-4-dehydrorhamnose reductase [Simkaniaceae bacterium]|nr:MAG: dTDP-4-dehydrorhamnose reductase [Simkaniaceae bacterium]